MQSYQGRCHCGSLRFSFNGPPIERGLRCNCSLCRRKGASMTPFTIDAEQMHIEDADNTLSLYQFGSNVAKHYFCSRCGIYTFHETLRKPGAFRVNLGCLDGIDALRIPCDVFDGASL